MKNTILKIIGSLLMVVVLISCDKDAVVDQVVNEVVEAETPSCNIKLATEESYYLGTSEGSRTSTYTYNADGFPDKINFLDGIWSTDFFYNGGEVSKVIETYGSSAIETTYEWDGAKLVKYRSKETGSANVVEYRYEYSGDKLSKRSWWLESVSGEVVEQGSQVLTWTGDNVTKMETSYINEETNEWDFYTITFTHNTNVNPFQSFDHLGIEGHWFGGTQMSANNVLSLTYTDTSTTETISYTYEYNTDNFPTKRTEIDGDYTYVETYEYNCN